MNDDDSIISVDLPYDVIHQLILNAIDENMTLNDYVVSIVESHARMILASAYLNGEIGEK